MRSAVIISATRLPTGRFLGVLKGFSAPQLGSVVIREAVRRAGIDPALVEECIMGNVVSAGLGQAPARQAALHAGLSHGVAALTINKVCGSGLKAVALAAQAIEAGDIDTAVAGGMESMSNAPYLLGRAREGLRMGHDRITDAMIHDGLWCAFEGWHMGNAAELVAVEYGIGRSEQDGYALESQRRAAEAALAGRFKQEIVPVSIPQKRGGSALVETDESIRADSSPAALAALEPAFKSDGTVTAGNAPPVNDGAAALVLMEASRARELGLTPMARVVGRATSGLAPRHVLMTPVAAVRRLAEKVQWTLDAVDLFEINEAFAVQLVAVLRELGLRADNVNVNGGAIALGHPIGASGARILVTLIHALAARNMRRGIAALCLGGGNGLALAVERI